ncbi:hypothetical protein TIFTF001_029427 [Ficus carica]|uniref:Uncharacterized protein n=1 Tax=Ficus carica TaxID=3494 RepID=A0AA88J3C6_FICCA|nr:hypothetical protein TIFTF001_029427 [Ficus carica]
MSLSLFCAGGFTTVAEYLSDGDACCTAGFRDYDLESSTMDDDSAGLRVGAPSVSSGDCNHKSGSVSGDTRSPSLSRYPSSVRSRSVSDDTQSWSSSRSPSSARSGSVYGDTDLRLRRDLHLQWPLRCLSGIIVLCLGFVGFFLQVIFVGRRMSRPFRGDRHVSLSATTATRPVSLCCNVEWLQQRCLLQHC